MLKRLLWLALLSGMMLIGAGITAAQDDVVNPDGEATFANINLRSNFVLDPFIVSVIGGGLLPASDLSADCAGYIPPNPSAALNLEEGDQALLRIFFYSDDDTVMVVRTPSGEFVCEDDTNYLLLDPTIDIADPEAGRYAIWIGTYAQGYLAPGFLAFSHSEDVSTATLDFSTLVERGPQPAYLDVPEFDASLIDLAAEPAAGVHAIASGFGSLEIEAAGGGDISASSIDSLGGICVGFIPSAPVARIQVADDVDHITVFFNSTTDSTLMVFRPDGAYACNDDASGVNLNPSLSFTDVPAGEYLVYVGSFDPLLPVNGTLVISEDPAAAPEMLANPNPVQPPAGQ